MLRSLHIRNFALIETLDMEFASGFNVLTGETGAGKSIIIQALSLLRGDRGRSDWIRKGADAAQVHGVFAVAGHDALLAELGAAGIPLDGDELIIQRTLSHQERNQVRLNGLPATVGVLQNLGRLLVDIVAQKDSESLLDPTVQRELLDQFGRLAAARQAYAAVYDAWVHLEAERAQRQTQLQETRQLEDFLKFQFNELQQAKLEPGEEEHLQAERSRVRNAAQLNELCQCADEWLSGGEANIQERVGRLLTQVGRYAELDPELKRLYVLLESVEVQVGELHQGFSRYARSLDVDPGGLDKLESRLAQLADLKRKYKADIPQLIEQAVHLRQRLQQLEFGETELAALEAQQAELGPKLRDLDERLYAQRCKAATALAQAVESELKDLGMERARFSLHWEGLKTGNIQYEGRCYDSWGSRHAVFFLQANPGEESLPLARVASGGERSRILLALKKCLQQHHAGTSVFDEVDEGVGGPIASRIGEKLAVLAQQRQVLCITHQAQIAAYASQHFFIGKTVEAGRTLTQVQCLASSEREAELARMLSGKTVSAEAKRHAKELIKSATLAF